MTTSLRLPLTVDLQLLLADLATAERSDWGKHYNTHDYSGEWSSIALYSASGRSDDVFALPADQFYPTPLLVDCTYFSQVLRELNFEKEAVRLLRLKAGSCVHPHQDAGLAYRFGVFRLHIPLITAADVEFEVAGQLLDMQAGTCWYADFDAVHAVRNNSTSDRIHLVIDGRRNMWTDEWFAQSGYDFEAEKNAAKMDPATLQKVIDELRLQNNPAAEEIIAQLNATHRS